MMNYTLITTGGIGFYADIAPRTIDATGETFGTFMPTSPVRLRGRVASY